MPRNLSDDFTLVDTMPILDAGLESHRWIERLEHVSRDLDPGDHAGHPGDEQALALRGLRDTRVGGDVPLRTEVLGEGATDHLDVVGTKHQLTAVICALVGSIRVRCSCIGSGSG